MRQRANVKRAGTSRFLRSSDPPPLSAYRLQQRPRAKPALLNNNIASKKPVTELLDSGLQSHPFDETSLRKDAQKDQPRHRRPPPKHKFAEILIFGQKQPAFVMRTPYHFHIGCAGCDFSYVDYVMSRAAKPGDEAGINAFIREPAHAGADQR